MTIAADDKLELFKRYSPRRLFRKPETAEAESIFHALKEGLARDGDLIHAAFCACAVAK